MAKNHFPQVSQWSFGGYLVYESDLGILSYLRLLKKSRTMHPSHQSNLLFVLNTIKVRRKEKQSSCPLNIKLIKWANILPCLILFVYCIQHAIHTHSMLPLVLPIYMITYIIYIWLLVQVLPLYMITYMIQEFLLVSWHCVSRTLQTRSSPPLRSTSGEWWIYESQTPKLYTVRSKWMPGCLETPSQETNSKIEQKLWGNFGLASHTDRRGRAHVCYLTTQVRHELFSQRQHRSGEMIPAWTGPAKSCWCWPATEREATKSGPFQTPPCFTGSTLHYMDTDKVTIFETTLYKSCVQLFPMLPST